MPLPISESPRYVAGAADPNFDAIYVTPWIGGILAFWLVVPLAIGYWRFSKADL